LTVDASSPIVLVLEVFAHCWVKAVCAEKRHVNGGSNRLGYWLAITCVLVVFEFFFPDKAVFDSVENVGVVARSIEIIA